MNKSVASSNPDNIDLYQLGRWAPLDPIPPVLEECIPVDAGAVRFLIEARQLTSDMLDAVYAEAGTTRPQAAPHRDDSGPSLHVLALEDGQEWLRFDCFKDDPHYHYISHPGPGNRVCRLDEIANGDAIEWTLQVLQTRLPEMLEFAGASDLAKSVRSDREAVAAAVDSVRALLRSAETSLSGSKSVGSAS